MSIETLSSYMYGITRQISHGRNGFDVNLWRLDSCRRRCCCSYRNDEFLVFVPVEWLEEFGLLLLEAGDLPARSYRLLGTGWAVECQTLCPFTRHCKFSFWL